MKIKGITDECFSDYKIPSMYFAFPHCTFKCDKECGQAVCQNSLLARSETYEVSDLYLIERYVNNPISKAIVIGGLEPFDDYEQLIDFIAEFRNHSKDDIVIYTGYTEYEIFSAHPDLKDWLIDKNNIVIKFGRFVPDQPSHFDATLGVNLASPNQYAKFFGVREC